MNLRYPTTIATSLILFAAFPFPAFAQSKQLVSSRCRGDRCWELYLLNKTVLRQDTLDSKPRTVYEVEIENKTPPPQKSTQRKDWVQCSTKRPFVASTDDFSNKDQVLIMYINPGGQTANATIPSHRIYWATCHGIPQADISKMATKAKSLGYSLQLEESSDAVPKATFEP